MLNLLTKIMKKSKNLTKVILKIKRLCDNKQINEWYLMNRVPFYFMRHAETDHNAYRIYNDVEDVDLNITGISQARQIQNVFRHLSILILPARLLKI